MYTHIYTEKLRDIEIGTVDGFQGREKEGNPMIIIIWNILNVIIDNVSDYCYMEYS